MINLSRLSDDVAADLLARINEPRISPRSDSDNSSPAGKFKKVELQNEELKEKTKHQAMDPTPLHIAAGTTPQGTPIGGLSSECLQNRSKP